MGGSPHESACYRDTDGPGRVPSPALLEIVVLINDERDEIIIHAMPMRPQYGRLLEQ